MKRGSYLVLLAAAVIFVATASAGTSARSGIGSTVLEGKLVGISNFFAPACTSVTTVCSKFEISGSIQGDGTVFVDTFPNADGESHAHTVIQTKFGDLRCHEIAIFDLIDVDHGFVDLCQIDGGTGRYTGAAGYIQEVGTFDFAANVGGGHYHGKLVLATSGLKRH
jgi:hypothetical protein